ncbi:hypothetical protein CRUP_022969 [Coryphaenoides rupestris]|nr:hypothetical protein CRUP_022969 [Coryphaenoides rupestris]
MAAGAGTMYAKCKSLFLLHRCVDARHITSWATSLSRATTQERACERWARIQHHQHHQYHHWSSPATPPVQTRTVKRVQSAARVTQQLSLLCTKAGPSDDDDNEYPPLPDYSLESERANSDVYLVHAKGLPWACTAEAVLQFFSECRVRGGVKGVHLTLNDRGKPSGQALIEMADEGDVGKALEKHRQYLGLRYVEVYEVTNSDAEAMLKASASVRDTCAKAGRPVYHAEAGQPVYHAEAGEPVYHAEAGEPVYHAEAGGPVYHAEADGPGAQAVGRQGTVRIRGLPFDSTEEDIHNFFSGLEIVEDGVTIMQNAAGRNKGQAYVRFSSQDMADEALERDRGHIGHRYIEVFPCTTEPRTGSGRRRGDEAAYSRPWGQTSGEGGWQSDRAAQHASSRPWEQHGGASSPAGNLNYVHMRGIPFQASGRDIARFFSPLSLSKILLEFGPEGKPRGAADVFFRSHQDAVSAMSRDGQYLGERYIELFLNSNNDTRGD